MIPSLHHDQMAPHVRLSGAFGIYPSNRMETLLLDFRILAVYHPLVCVEIPSRGSSGSPQMAQTKSHIYQSRSYSVIRPRGLAVPRGGTAGLAGFSSNLAM